MDVYKLEKAIENDKLDLHLAMEQIKKRKNQLSQSLKEEKS